MGSTRIFYAVLMYEDDNDWGYGSYDLEEAKEMAESISPYAFIAVIEEDLNEHGEMVNNLCIDQIARDDF